MLYNNTLYFYQHKHQHHSVTELIVHLLCVPIQLVYNNITDHTLHITHTHTTHYILTIDVHITNFSLPVVFVFQIQHEELQIYY